MLEGDLLPPVEATVRGIASAARALRLYPPSSPIPRQSLEAAAVPLRAVLDAQASLTLNVSREGFACRGTNLSSTIAGASEMADMLRSHGVAEVVFSASCTTDDLLGFLSAVMHAPELLRHDGGITAALAKEGVAGIRVVTVSLTTTADIDERPDGDVDEFFRELASTPEKLATWLAAAANGDPATLAEGLDEIAKAAGPGGMQQFLDTLAAAFDMQETDGKDILFGIGMEDGAGRDIVGGMLGRLPDGKICDSLASGLYGKNMLSLSTALTRLPLGTRIDEIIAEVRASLPKYGHAEGELEFLDHMVEVRKSDLVEAPLAARDAGFAATASAAEVDDASLASTREEVAQSVARTAAHSVPTMLALLDQQRDFALYVKSLDSLAMLVPSLVREHELRLAVSVLREISERESRTNQPWPELTLRLRQAIAKATGHATMVALLQAVTGDPDVVGDARMILNYADDAGKRAFVEEALARHDEAALDAAEALLGRRIVDVLAAAVPYVGPGQLGLLVQRLARYGDQAALQAVHEALRRPEELARAQAAEAMAGATNPMVVRHLASLLRDPSERVALAAARSLAHSNVPGCSQALAERLEQLDVDNKDFTFARELMGCLAQLTDPTAEQALRRLRDRKALIKRGRFADVQRLAGEALAAQAQRRAR